MSEKIPVMIVGAGPSGLVLALWLIKRGIKARIIDKSLGPGTSSRALAVQARMQNILLAMMGPTVPPEHEKKEKIEFNDVANVVKRNTGLEIGRVNWFSTYHVHHRVVGHFRQGRVFLVGDAAHIHSPVGGQGMNTGIGDAVNLAWKLVDVIEGNADPALLESYIVLSAEGAGRICGQGIACPG